MALYFCAMYVLGASLGPVGTGLASDYFTFRRRARPAPSQPLPFGAIMLAGTAQPGRRVRRASTSARSSRSAPRGCTRRCTSCRSLATILAVVLFAASRTVKKDVDEVADLHAQTAG